jgi:hypothetical protein
MAARAPDHEAAMEWASMSDTPELLAWFRQLAAKAKECKEATQC